MTGIETISAFISSFTADDRGPCSAFLDESCTIVETDGMPHSGTYTGHGEIFKLWDLMDKLYNHYPSDIEMLEAGEIVLIRQIGNFESRSSGARISMPIVELWWTKGGKIVRIESYYKNPAALSELSGGQC